jgi:hypothetical protein
MANVLITTNHGQHHRRTGRRKSAETVANFLDYVAKPATTTTPSSTA